MRYIIHYTQINCCTHHLFCFCCEGYSNETSGLCGSLLLGTGFVGAIASGILAEKTGKMEQIAKAGETLKGYCYEMAIFVEGLNILITFALMIFRAFQKLITVLYNYNHFVYFFEISY
jgi:hypothetical protein